MKYCFRQDFLISVITGNIYFGAPWTQKKCFLEWCLTICLSGCVQISWMCGSRGENLICFLLLFFIPKERSYPYFLLYYKLFPVGYYWPFLIPYTYFLIYFYSYRCPIHIFSIYCSLISCNLNVHKLTVYTSYITGQDMKHFLNWVIFIRNYLFALSHPWRTYSKILKLIAFVVLK